VSLAVEEHVAAHVSDDLADSRLGIASGSRCVAELVKQSRWLGRRADGFRRWSRNGIHELRPAKLKGDDNVHKYTDMTGDVKKNLAMPRTSGLTGQSTWGAIQMEKGRPGTRDR
jgi:hypothetical protein